MRAARVRIPASSANLGPGYDSFGLALALFDVLEAEPSESWTVEVVGEGAGELPVDESSAVVVAMKAVLAEVGAQGAFRVRCENAVPPGVGLGSSAAALVGGLTLADCALGSELPRTRLFELAARIEGHPDNVAPALFGGLTLCWDDEGVPRYARVEPAGGFAVVAIPGAAPLPTAESRRLLPENVPHADAAFTAARAGLLVAGLTLGRPELVRAGLADRIHEPYREAAVTDLGRVRATLMECGADGAALSGAGPTVIGVVHARDDASALARAHEVAARAALMLGGEPGRAEPIALAIDRSGATVC